MEKKKQLIARQLVANIIKDRCLHCEDILFEESWCTQDRCIRFTLPIFRALFPPIEKCSTWDTGDFAMFEVYNNFDGLEIKCVFSHIRLPKEYKKYKDVLFRSFKTADDMTLWEDKCVFSDPNKVVEYFDMFLKNELADLKKRINEIFILPHQEIMEEGAVQTVTLTRYERNRKARELCLAYHGFDCKICGMNFERTYGSDFKDVIEVHHIVPISQIGENYVVDPINDLMPICPNCHTVAHIKMKTDFEKNR